MEQGESLVRVEGLAKSFWVRNGFGASRKVRPIFSGITLNVSRGEYLALVGESGCGKTTLGRCLLRFIEPDAGRVIYNSVEITRLSQRHFRRLRPRMQMIFQNPALAFNPRQTIGEALAEPLYVHAGVHGRLLDLKAGELLESVGLAYKYGRRYPNELSGGQLLRAAIARALALDPEFLIADEPTSSLDAALRQRILHLLRTLQQARGLSMLLITHDLHLVKAVADRVAIMHAGGIVECAPAEEIFHNPQHAYTRRLLECSALSRSVPA